MPDTDDMALWFALYQHMVRYWFDVDHNGGNNAHTFYLHDALYVVGDNRFEGQDKIRAFYERRRQRGAITARHVVTNLLVSSVEDNRPRLGGLLSLYYAHGNAPHYGVHPPMMVADIAAECALDPAGRWHFQSHVLTPLFIGHDTPISLAVDPGRL